MAARDPYTVLGVDKSADEKAIKSAFRKLAKKYHPDQNQNDPKAKERFAQINQAYEILGDTDKRKQFDRGEIDNEGKQKFTGFEGFGGGNPFGGGRSHSGGADPFGGSGFGGAEDILKEMFGSAFGGSGGRGAGPHGFSARTGFGGHGPAGGPGGGFGAGFGGGPGSGRHNPADLDIKLKARVSVEELARGKASIAMPDGKTVSMSIPEGAKDGQTIRLKGKGKSIPGHGHGDALVTIVFQPHPDFTIEGENLRTNVKVPLAIAVNGGKVAVSTLDGRVSLAIPPWTTSGKVMRLKGLGLPKKGGGHGDIMVMTLIDLPETPDENLKKLLG